jgi:hypothetical protein
VAGSRKDSGAVLLMALVAVIVVSALGASLVTVALRAVGSDRVFAARGALDNSAESGAEFAIWKLARDPTWRGGEAVPVPGGECDVSVTHLADDAFVIVSRASRDGLARAIRIVVERAGHRYRVTGWELPDSVCVPPSLPEVRGRRGR